MQKIKCIFLPIIPLGEYFFIRLITIDIHIVLTNFAELVLLIKIQKILYTRGKYNHTRTASYNFCLTLSFLTKYVYFILY